MLLEVNGMGRPTSVAPPAPQTPEAAPQAATPETNAQPQTPSGIPIPQSGMPTMPPGAEAQPAGQPAPQAAAPSGPIVLYGRTFASREDAEGYVRHLVKSAEGRKDKEIGQLRSQLAQPQAAPTVATPETTPAPERAYDPETYALIKGRFGEDAAEDYRARSIAEFNRKVAAEIVSKELQPIKASAEESRFEAEAKGLFEKASQLQGRDGKPLFPELLVNESGLKVIQIWQGLPLEFAMTPEGVYHAVMHYRGAVAGLMPASPQPPPSVAQPSGVAIDASVGPTPGFAPGSQQPSNIPRPSAVNPLTGERYTR